MPMRENGFLTTFRLEGALAVAFGIALVATLAALFIGEVLGQMPCTLCWYQRIAMFPLVPILGIGALRGDTGVRIYALPLALAGLALALWHSGLYAGLIPAAIAPCTASGPSCTDQAQVVLGLPLPYLSTIAFAAILASLSLLKGSRA
jgi:disulfide bond formation protein DsbB